MIDNNTAPPDGLTGPAPAPAGIRAERRRLIEAIRALRRLLDQRPAFEVADRRRLENEARVRRRVEDEMDRALRRVRERLAVEERSLAQRLAGLDGRRESQEEHALAVLRREFVQRRLSATRLTAVEVNGIGSVLIRDLEAHGIGTAADFERISWGKAPNGKGGDVLYIHRTNGGRVHINGIGEHRGRPLMEWRRAAVARAEARAPRTLPPDERHRIAEIVEAERARLREALDRAPLTAEAALAEVVRLRTEADARLAALVREAARLADERRAEFDAMAERLLALQAELSDHKDRYGDAGLLIRRAQSRALRPVPALPAVPAPRTPRPPRTPSTPSTPLSLRKDEPFAPDSGRARGGSPAPAPSPRAGLRWLLPVLYYSLVVAIGVGELGDETPPLWLRIASRLLALAAVAELLRLWIPRRRHRSAGPMPRGTGFQTSGVFFSLTAMGMLANGASDTLASGLVSAVLAVLLLLAGTGHRLDPPQDARNQGSAPTI